jgi:polyphosphate kinase
VRDEGLKREMMEIFDVQFADTAQAVSIQADGSNSLILVPPGREALRSQRILSARLNP